MGSRINLEIEYLRGIAVLAVIFFHTRDLLPAGFAAFYAGIAPYVSTHVGVDLFFVISGYVVSRAFLDQIDNPTAHGFPNKAAAARAFWTRRIFRLWPSAWLWITLFVVAAFWFNRSGVFTTPDYAVKAWLWIVTNTFNFFLPFDTINGGRIGPYWTLSLEEQFYLAFPFFAAFVPAKWRLPVLLTALALSFALLNDGFIAVMHRIDPIMWGVVLHLLSRRASYSRFEPTILRHWPLATIATMGTFAALFLAYKALEPFYFRTAIIAMICAAIVYAASFEKGYVWAPRLLKPVMLWTGSRSYALYLIHAPVFWFTHELWFRIADGQIDGTFTLRYTLTAFPLLFLLAELNYRLIETPFRQLGKRLASCNASGEVPAREWA